MLPLEKAQFSAAEADLKEKPGACPSHKASFINQPGDNSALGPVVTTVRALIVEADTDRRLSVSRRVC